MGTKDIFSDYEAEAKEILLLHEAIERCPMDNSHYHNTGIYTVESLNNIPAPSEEVRAEMVKAFNDAPFGIDCTYCHSKEEEID
ncbi:MAG: hypothetical protein IJM46_15130 [Oscillospiraceae bacterium]|nr:hypothetical protein [Oscillospiraceae bacterium]